MFVRILLLTTLLLLTGCKVMTLQERELHQLSRINTEVNESITYAKDKELHNKRDYWQTPEQTLLSLKGDCEDYAILKASKLDDDNYPYNLSILVIHRTFQKDYHAVLLANNHYVLDNNRDKVYTIHKLKRQSTILQSIDFKDIERYLHK